MDDNNKPLQELNQEDTQAARDIVICSMIIGMCVPSAGQTFYNYLATEFASGRMLPSSLVRLTLRDLGTTLYREDWTLTITKNGQGIRTNFEKAEH